MPGYVNEAYTILN